jgi:hypothetical protein
MPPRDPDDRLLEALRHPAPGRSPAPGLAAPSGDVDGRGLDAVEGDLGVDDLDRFAGGFDDDGLDDALLARLGDIAREVTSEDGAFEDPPPSVWAGIAAAVEADATRSDPPAPGPWSAAAGPEGDARAHAPGAGPPRARRSGPRFGRRPPTWMLASMAAAVLLVVGLVAVVTGSGGGDDVDIVASARLEPLQEARPVTADLVADGDVTQLTVPLAQADLPPEPGAYYEVWLIDTEVVGMVSLGPLRSDGTYDIPAGVDYRQYPIVDVSIEPDDGVPTHSSNSILRGTLA